MPLEWVSSATCYMDKEESWREKNELGRYSWSGKSGSHTLCMQYRCECEHDLVIMQPHSSYPYLNPILIRSACVYVWMYILHVCIMKSLTALQCVMINFVWLISCKENQNGCQFTVHCLYTDPRKFCIGSVYYPWIEILIIDDSLIHHFFAKLAHPLWFVDHAHAHSSIHHIHAHVLAYIHVCIILPQASSYILGDEARAKTRAQTRKLSESEEKKPAVKRASTMEQTAKVSSVCSGIMTTCA